MASLLDRVVFHAVDGLMDTKSRMVETFMSSGHVVLQDMVRHQIWRNFAGKSTSNSV